MPQPPSPRLHTDDEADAMLPRRVSQTSVVCTARNESRAVSPPRTGWRDQREEQAMSICGLRYTSQLRSRRQERLVQETCASRVNRQGIGEAGLPRSWLHDEGPFWNRVAEAEALRPACDGRRGQLHDQAVSGTIGWRWRVSDDSCVWPAGWSQASMRRPSGGGARQSREQELR